MTLQVGIPRAMGYYYLYPFFRTLLSELGAIPVLSPPTNPHILEGMDTCPTDEPCLAVKLCFAHADLLARRRDIDLLFLPVIAQCERTYCCPKFIGVADMIRHGLRLPDERVLMPVLDYTEDHARMAEALMPMAERLGVINPATLRQAIRRADAEQQRFRDLCVSSRLTTPEVYRLYERNWPLPPSPPVGGGVPVAVIGHPYILYDVSSQQMVERLRAYGPVITAEMVAPEDAEREIATIADGKRLWPFEAALLGGAMHLLRRHAVEKMILVGSFECGPESMIETYIDEEARRQGIPLMVLALDEHSGEAGLLTRLEAFMDTDRAPGHQHAASMPLPGLRRDEMVLGFPSMGHMDTVVRTFVESFGTRTVPTPRTTKQCVELGHEIAPEFVCFPFTATLGQMRYLLDHGANTLLMVGGKGYCRLGWYAQVQEQLLRNLGYDFQLLVVDSPFPLGEKWAAFRDVAKAITGNAPWPRILHGLYGSYHQLVALDRAEALAHRLRAFERITGTTDKVVDRYLRLLSHTNDPREVRRLERALREEAAAIEVEDTHPLRVRIVGEIWVVLEQFCTREVERWLGTRRHPRVWVEREHSGSDWFCTHVLRTPSAQRRARYVQEMAQPWLPHRVGGHGQHTLGQAALAQREGMDGVLHIFPFTCMPEIIAQNIMVRMSEELDLPVLTYIVSEQTGEAGMETRLEAFLDLLEERRRLQGEQAVRPEGPHPVRIAGECAEPLG